MIPIERLAIKTFNSDEDYKASYCKKIQDHFNEMFYESDGMHYELFIAYDNEKEMDLDIKYRIKRMELSKKE